MATNYIQMGHNVTLTATAAVASGAGVLAGSMFGIAQTAAATGEEYEIATVGVYEMAKVSAQAWTVGALIYWDNTNSQATTASSSNTLIGVATEAAANPSSVGRVRLNGSFA